ncbi:hypothetical protein [Streptomyces fradiae]|uniref:hypothetical protein n=1 Tax=Streptomyces fradiae TaxID=1906 RepID=UPI00382C3341
MPRTAVAGAVAIVEALVPEDDGSAEAAMREKLALRYNTVRPFPSLLGESDALDAAPAGRRVLKAVRRLPALTGSAGNRHTKGGAQTLRRPLPDQTVPRGYRARRSAAVIRRLAGRV